MSMRFAGCCWSIGDGDGSVVRAPKWVDRIWNVSPENMHVPLHWRKSRRVLVSASMDLFDPDVSLDYIAHIFAIMQSSAVHRFHICTIDVDRMRSIVGSVEFWDAVTDFGVELLRVRPSRAQFLPDAGRQYGMLPNVWLGVRAQDQESAVQRLDVLMETAAVRRFVWLDPLRGPVDMRPYGVDWVIAGGPVGPDAVLPEIDWVREICGACQENSSAFYFTGWGGRTPRTAGCVLDGKTWNQIPA